MAVLIKIRILVLAALWVSVGVNSPFLKHFLKSFLFVIIEHGIHFERRILRIIKKI